ncbi:alpha-L-rhamnosidase C-terminal domain-containing protein [Paenibacillus sonchi]|uniref:alpha-L-rhamnosidase-related protein n=1 Tax=Paenibacillus sonchi TaxID=373687 RepID=UPI0002D78546|nr:alpha-L-rhamnosidase C-terminal domain-containing protein [Paenibacillus sonchi]
MHEKLAQKSNRTGNSAVLKDRSWQAQWIWDVQQPESNPEMNHHLVYFRRTFQLPDGVISNLVVDITADSRYKFYVNGHSIAVGPCKGDSAVHYYETLDVSEYLQPGLNVLAVQVLHYPASQPFVEGKGGPKSIWRTQSGGLLVEACLCQVNGDEIEPLHTNEQWHVYRHQGYKNIPQTFIRWMGGVEEVDGAGAPFGWNEALFDDSEWPQAITFANTSKPAGNLSPWQLSPRPIPLLFEKERAFVKVTRTEGIAIQADKLLTLQQAESLRLVPGSKAVIELDAGELTTGYLTIGLRGGQGGIVRILCSECYEDSDSTEQQRKKSDREDTTGKLIGVTDIYHVAGSQDRTEIYEPFLFRTFRFVRLEMETAGQPLELVFIKYRETGYPLDVKASFECSDEEMNRIWNMSVRTLQRCMHETYEDCPYYEQLQYAMDSRLMMLFTYNLSADDRMARRTIADFYRSRLPSGLLQSRFPSMESQVIPSFCLYWVDMIADHYEHYGDVELVKQYRPAMMELMDWFQAQMTEDGIVGITSQRYWTYFDWVEAWPLGAPPESREQPMYMLSLMYAASLRKAAGLFKVTRWLDAADELDKRAGDISAAVRKAAWSKERKLFRELPDTEIYTQHSQIMAVLAGAVSGEEARLLLERTLAEPMHRVTLPFAYLLFQALKQTGLQHRTFELWDRWRAFLAQGLTTLPETEVNPRSDCHAWSAVPLTEFPAIILGMSSLLPGCKEIRIEPSPGKLKWAKGTVATVHGMIGVEWRIEGARFQLEVQLPDGISARIKLPDGTEKPISESATFDIRLEKFLETGEQ